MNKKPLSMLLTATAITALSVPCQAATVSWLGGDGEYTNPSNWEGGTVPNTAGGDTALIGSGNVTYTPGGDLMINNGGTLQIAGGSWTQAGGGAWIQLGGGNLVVSGGTFNQGSSGNINRNADSVISISGGVANFSGNFSHRTDYGQFNLTGGVVNVANEFKPIATFQMSGGELNANLISFADGPGSILLAAGLISVNGAAPYSGFYGGGATKGVDFTSGSTGSLFFANYTMFDLIDDNFMINGTIKYNGVVDANAFNYFEGDGGVYITLIPEPSTAGLAMIGIVGGLLGFRRRS